MLTFTDHDLMEWIHHLYLEHPEVRTDPAVSALYFILFIYLLSLRGCSFTSSPSLLCESGGMWPRHLYYSGWSSNVGKSRIIKGAHKHLMVWHEYFRVLNIIQKWPLETTTLNKAHLRQITSAAGATRGPFSCFFWLFFFFFFVARLDWFVICNRESLATGLWIIQFIALPFITNFCGFWVHCHIDSLIACLAGS